MLEIIILYKLAGNIGKIIEGKGRQKGGYQVMLVALWFGGEILGGLVGAVVGAIALDGDSPAELLAYAFALGGAILGAVIAFVIAKSLDPLVVAAPLYENLDYVDRLGAREHFGERKPAPPPVDGYTKRAEKSQRPSDDRIQE